MNQMIKRIISSITFRTKKYHAGDKITISRKITQEDIDTFTKISGDTNPIHSSEGLEPQIVHGAFLNSLVSAVIGTKLPGPGTMVLQQTLNFPRKCFVGEVVDVTVQIVEDRKIIKVNFSCSVAGTKTVLYGTARIIMS